MDNPSHLPTYPDTEPGSSTVEISFEDSDLTQLQASERNIALERLAGELQSFAFCNDSNEAGSSEDELKEHDFLGKPDCFSELRSMLH